MSIRLITGIPNAGKSTWVVKNCSDGKVIHTDDLYFSRYHDLPEDVIKNLDRLGLYNGSLDLILDRIIVDLADKEELYYLEGSHIMWWTSFNLMYQYLYKIIICDPQIAYERGCRGESADPDLRYEDFVQDDKMIKTLASIFPNLMLDLTPDIK